MQTEYKGKTVLLLDGYGRQIPSILHQLHELGCVVTTVCESKLDVGYTSRYPQKRIVVKGIRENKKVYRQEIENELKRNHYDILFPVLEVATDICIDGDFQDRYRNLKIIASSREAFLKAYDKQQTMQICMENQIPCPITKMDNETMEEFLAKIDLMMDQDHKPQSTLVVESCRWFPIDGGPGCYIRTINHKAMAAYSNRLLECLDWTSFGHIGFIMDPRDHTPKVMEINGRIPASIKICEWAGTKPVKNMLDLAYGKTLTPMKKRIPENLALRYFHTDLLWLIKNPNRLKAKPSWFYCRKQRDYIFSWQDPIPFFSYAIEHILTYRKDMAKRRH